jgi:hypothetical protein
VNYFGRPGVVLDPMGELAITAGRVEDWLCLARPSSYEAAVVSGARAAGAICRALTDARGSAYGATPLGPLLAGTAPARDGR